MPHARRRGKTRRRRHAGRILVLAVLATVALTSVTVTADRASADPITGTAEADDGAKVVAETWLDDRTVDLTVDSPALMTTGMVRLIVPPAWRTDTSRTWPALYLLHGCCEDLDYQSWDVNTDVREFTEDKDTLVVMPTDGPAGMYSEWWNMGLRTTANWELFHTTEIPQILERGYRSNDKRAVAGVSIGGYGALAYSFRYPGMFGAAASYSGIPNTLYPGTAGVIKGILVREGFLNPADLWGDETVTFWIWREHNPFDHVEAFRDVDLYISSGNGNPGPLDPPGGGGDPLDSATLLTSRSFTDLLQEKGIPATVDYYGDGTHSWPYWERALHQSWPVLAKGLGLA